jgi:GxxExxY protein
LTRITQIPHNKSVFLYKDLGFKLLGIAFKLHNDYGSGHNERVYQKLLEEQLRIQGLTITPQARIVVFSKVTGKQIGLYIPDLVIENKIIVEIKATPQSTKRFEAQLLEYLNTTSYEVGYLLNFGKTELYYKRYIYTNDRKKFVSI